MCFCLTCDSLCITETEDEILFDKDHCPLQYVYIST